MGFSAVGSWDFRERHCASAHAVLGKVRSTDLQPNSKIIVQKWAHTSVLM